MRNLKTFESFSNEPLWKKIDLEQWYLLTSKPDSYFSDSEVSQIKQLSQSLGFDSYISTPVDHRIDSPICGISFGKRWKVIIIYKLEDEWFGVKVEYINAEEFYECDQIEGLLQLIKRLK